MEGLLRFVEIVFLGPALCLSVLALGKLEDWICKILGVSI